MVKAEKKVITVDEAESLVAQEMLRNISNADLLKECRKRRQEIKNELELMEIINNNKGVDI